MYGSKKKLFNEMWESVKDAVLETIKKNGINISTDNWIDVDTMGLDKFVKNIVNDVIPVDTSKSSKLANFLDNTRSEEEKIILADEDDAKQRLRYRLAWDFVDCVNAEEKLEGKPIILGDKKDAFVTICTDFACKVVSLLEKQ